MKITISLIITLIPIFGFSELTLEERIIDLENRVKALEGMEKLENPTEEAQTKLLVTDRKPLIKLTSWSYTFRQGRISPHYEIEYTLKNEYSKPIKLIDGSIRFADLLGDQIYGIKITPDIKIEPNGYYVEIGNYDINRFMSDDFRMSKMEKEDIVVNLVIRRIVFSDNTILELDP